LGVRRDLAEERSRHQLALRDHVAR
jgi:hypothetical protein